MNIVITGATKGIGRAIAEKFAENGFDLAVCSRNADDLDKMKADFKTKFPEVTLHTKICDVSDKQQVSHFAEFCKQVFNNVDILVNNAGVFIPGSVTEEEEGNLDLMMNTNLYSAYNLTRALVGDMIEKKSGHVFNICSIASTMAYPNGSSYSISKFALLGFSKVLRAELLEHNVRVTAILPGATYSASWEGFDIPQDRLSKASDVGDMVYSVFSLSKNTVVEEIVMRPQLGDL